MSNNEPIYEYDSNGNCIYRKYGSGYEQWCEFDSKGNQIHYRNSDGYEEWWEYDFHGDEIHYKNNDGCEAWYWKGEPTKDPVKILLLSTQVHSKASQ
jgi:hypothetical protein